jgi:hypothetical protein
MKTARILMKTESRMFSYNVGAMAVVAISIGLAAIIYGMGWLSFNLYVLPAWILGPWGVYTAVYSLAAGAQSSYYLVWGIVMITIAFISAFYNVANVLPVLGVLVIILAVIGIIVHLRGRK